MRKRSGARPSQIVTAARALFIDEHAAARARMREGGKVRKLSGPSGDARDAVAAMFTLNGGSISGRQLEKMIQVADAAAADPERFGCFLAEMDTTGSVNGPHTKMLRLRDELRVLALSPREWCVRTLLMDPPWPDEDVSDAQGHAYALMSEDEIAALPVPAWTEENSHLYLCSRNNTLPTALRLMARWGFAYKTLLTWPKANLGRGRYFRNTSEQILFGVRGELRTRSAGRSTRTVHAWPRPTGPESTKPPGLYDLIRACSYPPYGEAFQREPRPDFLNMFEAAPAGAAMEAAE